ncbi:hypothetical protein ABBQ38_008112 [Trebouxia sp. C0009 RCD-2024]
MSSVLQPSCSQAAQLRRQSPKSKLSFQVDCSNSHSVACRPNTPTTRTSGRSYGRKQRTRTVAGVRRCHVLALHNAGEGCKPMRVMISGAPATGKGTQCSRIVDKFGLVHISAGDLLRAEVAAGTDAGKEAASYMDSGNLVPNSVVVDMVVHRLSQPDVQEHGWLLDGYPRSGDQAEAIVQEGIKPDLFVLISVPDEDLVDRVAGRRLDPETGDIYHLKHKPPPEDVKDRLIQRSDDTAEKVKTRLRNHHSNVDAVLDYYQDVLVEVDGTQSMEEVFDSIDKHLTKLAESRSHHDAVAA